MHIQQPRDEKPGQLKKRSRQALYAPMKRSHASGEFLRGLWYEMSLVP
jgi:hypothetical protein